MKNIFNYATKELSQDAFLSWLIDNYDDPIIGEYCYRFINYLTGWNFKPGDIKKMEVLQQEHNIDVVVKIWAGSSDKFDYVMIIEDKTTSSAHSGQLERYAKLLDTWDAQKSQRCKIFYKVDKLSEKDEEELSNADKNYDVNDCWKKFDIEKIYDFFSNIGETKSEILNSYIKHIESIHTDINIVSTKPMKEWNYINYQTFFKEEIEKEICFKKEEHHFEAWQYQGRLVSVAFYYHPTNEKLNKDVTESSPCFAYPLVEFIFKKNTNVILVYSHITFHFLDDNNDDIWTWKYSNYTPNKDEAKSFLECVRDCLNKNSRLKTRKMNNLHDQTISVETISIDNSKEQIKKEIVDRINDYYQMYKEADKSFK